MISSDNIFELQVLLENIISDIKRIEQRQESTQKALAKLRADLVKTGILKTK